ncbi:hypothetical protein AB4440_10290 [Vibrio splendidus]|nr:hypothetical protein [Vibrio splendidus]
MESRLTYRPVLMVQINKVASGLFNTWDLVLAAQHLNPYLLGIW